MIAVLDELYPRRTAADWDSVGPVCGDPDLPVSQVLFAVDPVSVVVDEALQFGAQLLVTHHPLFLRGTTTVYADSAKGSVVQRLVTGGCGLYVAHTNADVARDGVSAALADTLGLLRTRPLVTDVPGSDDPAVGSGRVGELAEPVSLRIFAQLVAAVLPATPVGIRVAGDLDRPVSRVAVCGGAGDSYLGDATRAGADVYVTADLRHHYASEHLESGGPALIDPGHWASEWPWLARGAAALRASRATVGVRVSSTATDPWTLHLNV